MGHDDTRAECPVQLARGEAKGFIKSLRNCESRPGNFGWPWASEKSSACKDDEERSVATFEEDEQSSGLCSRPGTPKFPGLGSPDSLKYYSLL